MNGAQRIYSQENNYISWIKHCSSDSFYHVFDQKGSENRYNIVDWWIVIKYLSVTIRGTMSHIAGFVVLISLSMNFLAVADSHLQQSQPVASCINVEISVVIWVLFFFLL